MTDAFHNMVLGDREGYLAVAFGLDGYWKDTDDGGRRYTFDKAKWTERRYSWPGGRDKLLIDVKRMHAAGDRVDCYVCPAIRFTNKRKKGDAIPPAVCWVDLDGPVADTALWDKLVPFVVESGTEGHRHAYIPLDGPVDLGTWNRLQVALRDRLGGDDKIADNDLLRLPGTHNHKSDPPRMVKPISAQCMRWSPDELAQLLGVDAAAHSETALTGSAETVAAEPVDTVPQWLTHRFDAESAPQDRSSAFHALVGACRDAGLTQGQAVTLMGRWQPGVEKYGDRVPAEVARCWSKVAPAVTEWVAAANGDRDGGASRRDRLEDAHVAQWVADEHLAGRYLWTAGLGWLRWDGRRWKPASDKAVTETVRRALIERQAGEAKAGASVHRLKALSSLLAAHRIRAVVGLAAGICEAETETFDAHPDLLAVGNGVVDLTTGEIRPHDPDLRLTKATDVNYRPDATHADWTAALRALPAETADWMQVRLGQAATGHMTPDDLLPVCQGGGANGKTTLLGGASAALGEHAVTVPERVLISNPGDHPTELMTLHGARLALIEETPEARHLSVKRLKDTVGTPTMNARKIRGNNVSWEATHSLLLTTNYPPRVDETDHGTWRRLALVRFPYRFDGPAGDPGLRDRLRRGEDGQLEAALSWVVAGARRWYAAGKEMPPLPQRVAEDTAKWRAEADLVFAFITENLVFDGTRSVLATELLTEFNQWLTERGSKPWSDQTWTSRFGGHAEVMRHGAEKRRTQNLTGLSQRDAFGAAPTGKVTVWDGVRWATADDEQNPRSEGGGQGWTGVTDNPRENTTFESYPEPLSTPVQGRVCPGCGTDLSGQPAGITKCDDCVAAVMAATRQETR